MELEKPEFLSEISLHSLVLLNSEIKTSIERDGVEGKSGRAQLKFEPSPKIEISDDNRILVINYPVELTGEMDGSEEGEFLEIFNCKAEFDFVYSISDKITLTPEIVMDNFWILQISLRSLTVSKIRDMIKHTIAGGINLPVEF